MPFDWAKLASDTASIMDPQTAALIDLFRENMAGLEDRNIRAAALNTLSTRRKGGVAPTTARDERGLVGSFFQDIGILGEPEDRPLDATERQGVELGDLLYEQENEGRRLRDQKLNLEKVGVVAEGAKTFGRTGGRAINRSVDGPEYLNDLGDDRFSDIPFRNEELMSEERIAKMRIDGEIAAANAKAGGGGLTFPQILSLSRFQHGEARQAVNDATEIPRALRTKMAEKLSDLNIRLSELPDRTNTTLGSLTGATEPNPEKAAIMAEAKKTLARMVEMENNINDTTEKIFGEYGIQSPGRSKGSEFYQTLFGGPQDIPLGQEQNYDLGPLPAGVGKGVVGGTKVEDPRREDTSSNKETKVKPKGTPGPTRSKAQVFKPPVVMGRPGDRGASRSY